METPRGCRRAGFVPLRRDRIEIRVSFLRLPAESKRRETADGWFSNSQIFASIAPKTELASFMHQTVEGALLNGMGLHHLPLEFS
jgi:hypothetical protein